MDFSLFKCPVCGSNLTHDGRLQCEAGHSFPCDGNVVDFSTTLDRVQQRTRDSFEVEWTQYYPRLGWIPSEIQSETQMFLAYTRSMPNFFSGKIVVDAGKSGSRICFDTP